jgi:hypothetical protein
MSCFLSYTQSVTGDCSNTNVGAFTININGEAPDYIIQWLSPPLGTIALGAGVTAYTQTNLSGGTYSFNVIDSCLPTNTTQPINIYISTGTCVSLNNVVNTLCGSNNGTLTAENSNFYDTSEFYLYETTNGYITSGSSFGNSFTFNDLSPGFYYVVGNDGGGCTGKSETCIIKSSTTIDYGFYIVNDAGCTVNSGKVFITGLTGNPPYTYLWSNGAVTDSISGLTAGYYSVSVTDSTYCTISKSAMVIDVPSVGLGAFVVTSPSCFTSDGEVEVIITGGTAPYYYLGSNGQSYISFSTSQTFTGLGGGLFTVTVTDAGLCSFTSSISVLVPNGFSIATIGIINSSCNNYDGSISPISLFGGSGNYVYSLTYPDGHTISQSTTNSNWSFNGLSGGTYTLSINDGTCSFVSAYTIDNQVKYTLSTSTTGVTCGLDNGSVTLTIGSGGTPPYLYEIDGQSISTSFTSHTFNNLSYGSNMASVTDSSTLICKQNTPFFIDGSSGVDFTLNSTNATNGSNGTISTLITSGEPPFTLEWSNNVNGQTGLTITNLSASTYTLKVTDSNSCVKTQSVVINGSVILGSYQTYEICEDIFSDTTTLGKKGPKEMLNEGFYDLTSDFTDCILNNAIFTVMVDISGVTASTEFYTGYTLNDYPTDSVYETELSNLIESYPQIGDVILIHSENTIVIKTSCETEYLVDTSIKTYLKINYDISCVVADCVPPVPCTTDFVMSGYSYNIS